MIAARLTLTTVSLLLVASANAHPHHHQQLLYNTAGFQSPPSGYYYVPQADSASAQSVQRYAAPVPVALPPGSVATPGSPQFVLLYPGGGDARNHFSYGGGADVDVEGREEENNRPTIWNLFNVFQRPTTTPSVQASEEPTTLSVLASEEPSTTARASITSTTVATTVEETTPNSSDEASVKPEKIITDKDETMLAVEQSAMKPTNQRQLSSLETLDEHLPQSPPQFFGVPPPASSADGRQFTLVQRPQFFGNYDFFSRGADTQQRFGLPPGAVSNFLLFRNAGGFAQAMPPGRPLKLEADAEDGYVVPGSAALAFQQELKDAQQKDSAVSADGDAAATRLAAHIPGSKHVDVSQVFRQGVYPHFYVAPNPQQQAGGLVSLRPQLFPMFQRQAPPGIVNLGPGYQNVFLVSAPAQGGVVVDADSPRKEDADQVEAEQAGPSVAQAKPQAIALAGPGGVAAASPVATAVVGPGGLAVSAPTATAVAGPSGGGSLVGPAQAAVAAVNKHVTAGDKLKTRTRDQGGHNDDTYDDDQ